MPTQKKSNPAVAATTKKDKRGIDGGNSFDTKLETTETNTTTKGMGSVDDLLGLSFSGFNQTPSNVVPPSFSLFDFLSL
jgi:hypothetical protein